MPIGERKTFLQDAHAKTMTLLEQAEPATWSFFLPHVFRAVLGEGLLMASTARAHHC